MCVQTRSAATCGPRAKQVYWHYLVSHRRVALCVSHSSRALSLPNRAGVVLKPLEGERGAREAAFYDAVAHLALPFVPLCYGQRTIDGVSAHQSPFL